MKIYVEQVERTDAGYRVRLRTESPDWIGNVLIGLHTSQTAHGTIEGVILDREIEQRIGPDKRPLKPLFEALRALEKVQGLEVPPPDESL